MASMSSDDDEEPINEYEQQRLDRIARNKAELERLGIPDTIASMQQQIRAKKRQKTAPSARPTKAPSEPTRRSTRQRGVPAAPIEDIIEAAPIRWGRLAVFLLTMPASLQETMPLSYSCRGCSLDDLPSAFNHATMRNATPTSEFTCGANLASHPCSCHMRVS
jgi:hypothetical protein